MRAIRRSWVGAAALAATGLGALLVTSSATGDTESCTGRNEYEATTRFMSVGEVANLYDVPGWYIDTEDGEFRRGYRTCWAPGERKIVVFYDLSTGLSTRWDVRDV